ncbi:MAG: amidohydrolase [Aestuariivirga sp.]|uniref:amidohydrolase n=1 Tax=Aestuariivirga sp. TaxID=2650926 RepID=UPI0025BCCC51|nr:amidohydrolase [Aestuariivirga sp.]MCA3560828.1 amidohydrolase [Aestuariivirga sp.]
MLLNNVLYEQPTGFASVATPASSRRGFMALSTAAVIGSALPLAGAAPARADDAASARITAIFKGGAIVPVVGPAAPEAIAVSGNRIARIGNLGEVMAMADKDTQVVDLAGRTLLPGLIDPHHHTLLASIYFELLTDVGYEKNKTRAGLISNLRQMAAQTPAGQWITASNFDNLLQGGDLSREELDSVTTTHPVFVWYTNGHDAAVNSMALQAAAIPDDIGPLPGGGHFGRGPDGKLNGLIYEESAMLKVAVKAFPKITPQLASKAVRQYMQQVAAAGNTLVHEPGTIKSEWIEAFAKVSLNAPVRTSASLMYEDMKGYAPYKPLGMGAKAVEVPNSLFNLYGVKIVGDGSNQTMTGAQTQPYLDSKDKGKPNFTPEQMKEMVAAVKAAGLPVLIHCNGDETIDISLDAIEAAYGDSTEFGINRIEHATMARPDQLTRMKKLNVEPSFLMNHVGLYGAAYRDQIFGPERASFMDPAGACVKEDIRFTLHTDSPCSPIGPLRLIQTAVTRTCEFDNTVIGADQAISVQRALEAVTIDAARQLGMADRVGSLEVGKLADFTILEANPLTTATDKIKSIKVSETWVNGEKKFG